MAQLPPRVPNMPFPPPHNHHPPPPPPASWVDEFLDFTSARRGNHRRSMSDSVTFLEPPLHGGGGGAGFDRFDDDQLMSMFSDDFSGATSAGGGLSVVPPLGSPKSDPSASPNSDRNSNADAEKAGPAAAAKAEHGEVESSCNDDDVEDGPPKQDSGAAGDSSAVDPKRVKRILANRQSAQRSRVRKLQYISELERSVTTLQTEVSALSPRVAFLDHQRLILNVDNSAIKQRIAALAQDKIFKDAHQEALKKEIERLRQIYHHQNMKKLSSNNNNNNSTGNGEGASDNPPLMDQKMQLITS